MVEKSVNHDFTIYMLICFTVDFVQHITESAV
jgi:hypothetical protein